MKKNKGITLIALVITIIVLLILAGISIATLTGENGVLSKASEAKENTRGATVKEQVELWKSEKKANEYYSDTDSKIMTEKELLDDLELNQKILLKNERTTLETQRQVTIGNQTITLDGPIKTSLTSIYAKLYTDGTLILSSFDYTDDKRELQEDYKDIAGKEYGFSNGEPYGDFPGWFQVYYNDRYESYEMDGTKCDKVIIYDRIAPENMSHWFSDINEIAGIENLDTSHVADMSAMFWGSTNLTNLDVSGFDTTNATNMLGMFYGCSSLMSLDVSKFNTANVTAMGSMFSGCSSLTSLDVSKFNTANVTAMEYMFEECSNIEQIDISKFSFKKIQNVPATMNGSTCYMFAGCNKLCSLGIDVLDLEGVQAMENMFQNCSSLKRLKLKGASEKVRNCKGMFTRCVNLETVEFLDGFLNNTEAAAFLSSCENLNSVSIGKFELDEEKIYDWTNAFAFCSSLEKVDLGKGNCKFFDLEKGFVGCSNLKSVQLPVGEEVYLNQAFKDCSKLYEVRLNTKEISTATGRIENTFENCTSLVELDLTCLQSTGFSITFFETFKGCSALEHVYVTKDILRDSRFEEAFTGAKINEFTAIEN